MKDSPPSSTPPKTKKVLSTIPAIAVFFLFGYVVGLLCSSSTSLYAIPQPPIISPRKVVEPSIISPPPHDLFRFRTQCSDPIPHNQVLQTILTNVYNNTTPYKNFPTQETLSHLLPIRTKLRGWGSRNRVFTDLISSVRPRTIIELGTFLGASALHMASLTHNLSLSDTTILCLDDFRGWPSFQTKFKRDIPQSHHGDSLLLHQFMLNVVSAGEAERVVPMPFSTRSALAVLCEWGVYGDLIEVDAGHDFHSAWADINMAYAVLRPGGVLFGHDYFTAADEKGVRRAVTLFARVKGLKVSANGEHWVLEPKPQS